MIKLTMPDGSIREAEAGITALELVKSISNSLAKKVLAVSIDDKVMDLTTVLDKDAAEVVGKSERIEGAACLCGVDGDIG